MTKENCKNCGRPKSEHFHVKSLLGIDTYICLPCNEGKFEK